MNLKTYFDFSSAERMAMTREQVDALCAVALMQAGLVMPEPPAAFTEDRPSVKMETRYQVKVDGHDIGGLYLTMEEARTVAALRPRRVDRKYLGGSYSDRIEVEESGRGSVTVEAVEVATEAEYNRMRIALERWGEAKSRADSDHRQYESARTAAKKATDGVWEDWNSLQQRKDRINEARLTFAKYVDMCKGDKVAARNFLRILIDKDEREKHDVDGFLQSALGDEGLPVPEQAPPPHGAFETPAS